MVKQLMGIALLNDMAPVHHDDTVGNLADNAEVVSDEDDGDIVLGLQRLEQVKNGALHGDIESRGRLVSDEDVGVVNEGHGNHYSLFLSSADFVWVAVKDFLGPGEKYLLEKLDNAFLGIV